jgi:hypothetical protein
LSDREASVKHRYGKEGLSVHRYRTGRRNKSIRYIDSGKKVVMHYRYIGGDERPVN